MIGASGARDLGRRMNFTMKLTWALTGAGLLFGSAAIGIGLLDVAADQPHWPVTERVLGLVRDRSIAFAARGIEPPALDDPALLRAGARHYTAMCIGCHGAPGRESTELQAGLYPQPPDLSRHTGHRNAAETFWIIKHGLKMTAMPAWGLTHDDRSIWGLVAFLRNCRNYPQTSLRRTQRKQVKQAMSITPMAPNPPLHTPEMTDTESNSDPPIHSL